MTRTPIRTLPESVIAQVAAGEVVERPASVVKELIENSLDAGATEIIIEVERAGRESITVMDNGIGIPESELSLAVQPHSTSKLRQVEDLFRLSSYGFRGEALSSIAAVGSFRLESRTPQTEHGFFLEREAGEEKHGSIGMDFGTRVAVRRLFHDVPARQKFLKSEATEWRHIFSVIHSQALVHPEVGWQVLHNGKKLLDLPAGQNRINRLLSVIGEDIFTHFLPLESSVPHFGISGYISLPQFASAQRTQQLFVNQRPVESSLIQKSVRSAYAQLVELDAQPSFFLWLELPPETVDINIHPRKEMVRFLDERTVQHLVYTALQESLNVSAETAQEKMRQHAWLVKEGSTHSHLGKHLKNLVLETTTPESQEVWQLHDVFLLQPTSTGIRFVDQHAAHERILFERFLKAYRNEQAHPKIQELTETVSFMLPALQYQMLQEYQAELEKLGFSLELWDHRRVVIRAVPELFADRDLPMLITEVLQDLAEGTALQGIDTATQKLLAYLACRSAIKAGQPLTEKERADLLTELRQIPHNFTCPHGRPISIEFTQEELYTLFKRR